jgi:hypothetical protein
MFWNNKHKFTQEECKANGKWTCGPNVNKVPKYSGVSVPAAGIGVMDDGKKRAAVWTVPKPAGKPLSALTHVVPGQVSLDVDKHSTPYREGESVNGPTQPFIAFPALNYALTGWGNSTWNIGFQAPGLPPSVDGKTKNQWVATPTWRFTGDFRMTTLTNVTVDWRTGKITPTKSNVPVTAPGTCQGKPLTLSVYRARNAR